MTRGFGGGFEDSGWNLPVRERVLRVVVGLCFGGEASGVPFGKLEASISGWSKGRFQPLGEFPRVRIRG